MKTINELQDEVIEEFSDFDDWMDKYQLLIDLGNEQEPLAPEYKNDQNLILYFAIHLIWAAKNQIPEISDYWPEMDAAIAPIIK